MFQNMISNQHNLICFALIIMILRVCLDICSRHYVISSENYVIHDF